jgi:hypothetical protein
MQTTRASIDRFLALPSIAVVGVSRQPQDFSRLLWKELRTRGFHLVPVNANAQEIDGVPAFPTLQAVTPVPEGVLLMLPAKKVFDTVREAIAIGVKSIWFYRAIGSGAVDPVSVALAREANIEVIAGECPFMFLPDSGLPHSFHRAVKSFFGILPK